MSEIVEHAEDFIIAPAYKPATDIFLILPPPIESGYIYHFTTTSDLLYEVRFARKVDNSLALVVNFSVLAEEFEHEYSVTNRGELYSVIATVIEIIKMFHHQHNFTISYEFSGEFKENEDKENSSIRTRLYMRYANHVLNNNWKPYIDGNKVILKKIC